MVRPCLAGDPPLYADTLYCTVQTVQYPIFGLVLMALGVTCLSCAVCTICYNSSAELVYLLQYCLLERAIYTTTAGGHNGPSEQQGILQ